MTDTDAWKDWHKYVRCGDRGKHVIVFRNRRGDHFELDWTITGGASREADQLLGSTFYGAAGAYALAKALERAIAAGWTATWGGEF